MRLAEHKAAARQPPGPAFSQVSGGGGGVQPQDIEDRCLKTSRTVGAGRLAVTGSGVSQDMGDSRPGACRHVGSPACHHCCHCREAPGQRGGPGLRGSPVLGLCAAGPLRRRGRGGVTGRGPGGRRPRRMRSATPPPSGSCGCARNCLGGAGTPGRTRSPGICGIITGSRCRGDGRPVPDPGGPGGTRAEEAPEVVVHPLPGRAAQPVLAGRFHPLSARG